MHVGVAVPVLHSTGCISWQSDRVVLVLVRKPSYLLSFLM